MDTSDTFTLLPLQMDPQTKAISSTPGSSHPSALPDELAALNSVHRALQSLEAPHTIPPPPIPVNPKRSAQVMKLRESGNASFRKGAHGDAVRMYSLGIEMALARPLWEPAGLVKEELVALYSNRAQAYMAMQQWAEAGVDAQCSAELKKAGNGKAWWRRGKCLIEMGRLKEARDWLSHGLDFDQDEGEDLTSLMEEVENLLEKQQEEAAR